MLCWNSFQLLCTSKTLESLTVKACRLGLKPEDISMNMKYRISKGKLSLTILILTYLFYMKSSFVQILDRNAYLHCNRMFSVMAEPFSRDKEIMLCWNSFQLLCTSKTLESLTVKACRLGLKPEDISMNIFLMKYRISKGKLSLTILILAYLFYMKCSFVQILDCNTYLHWNRIINMIWFSKK